MTNNQLTDDRLAALLDCVEMCEDMSVDENAEMATALRELQERRKADSEPVAWLAIYHGEVYDEAIGITRSVVEAQADHFGWELALTEIIPLYRHAQPVVPDAAAVYAQLSDHEKWSTSLENVNHVLNAFRAAMLAAAPSQFHFSEGQVLLAPHIYRELVNDLKNTAQKYAGAGSLREALSQTLSRYIKPQHKS